MEWKKKLLSIRIATLPLQLLSHSDNTINVVKISDKIYLSPVLLGGLLYKRAAIVDVTKKGHVTFLV
jgi:hypothetical protein